MKFFAFFLLLFPCLLMAQFPTIPIDFESTANNYTFYAFGGVDATGPIANPATSGINASLNVLQLTKTTGAEIWAGVALPLAAIVDFSNGNILQMKVYSPRANVPILLKIEDTNSPPDGDGNPSISAEVVFNTTGINTWEVLNFDMTLDATFNPNNAYNQIVLFPDFGSVGLNEVFYLDDIEYFVPMMEENLCVDTIHIGNYMHTLDSTALVEHVVTSSGIVSNGSEVFYNAGSTICLEPNFTVNIGSTFEAAIDGCCDTQTWYQDVDGDGEGNPYITLDACTQPVGYVETPRFNVGYSTPLSYPGYNLVWADEFDNNILDPNTWVHDLGDGCPNVCGWGNNEAIWYQTPNATVADDFLTIEAKEEAVNGYSHTSSRIKTQGNESFQYGRIDVRAKLPYSQGLWPAIWMLGDNISTVGWPSCGEIDIMELIGGANNDSVSHGTGHWNDNGHTYLGGSYSLGSGIFADQFHVFSIIWNASTIQWFVDDTLFYTLDISGPAQTEFHDPFFFILNVSVGGNWPGYPDASSVFPQTMEVDYIRVFQ